MDISDLIWTFLPKSSYDYLLEIVLGNIRNSGHSFPALFQKFFLNSPNDFRKHFVDQECQFGSFLSECFDVEDTETIRAVFENVDDEDRTKFVSGRCFFEDFVCSTRKDNWHLVELCLREAPFSKEDKKRLQTAFMRFLPETEGVDIFLRKVKWERFFKCFDESDGSAPNKGSSEDETLT
ncbi:hypothetical protein AVEN_80729-1 [Araneus ventricosus]|uniref:Uncharacterized protein n=1 Tax=Araneus ventricosus TaxID=182803 RepID=A0A4Y2SKH6_ARAVE|nr:hypothetical protein AVEN_80729-1 [Araneus ventricosus]